MLLASLVLVAGVSIMLALYLAYAKAKELVTLTQDVMEQAHGVYMDAASPLRKEEVSKLVESQRDMIFNTFLALMSLALFFLWLTCISLAGHMIALILAMV